jgi:hypothetical protein
MTNNNPISATQYRARPEPGLVSRYGAIGIAALAAALKFKSATKNPTYAPVPLALNKWITDDA